MQPTTDLERFVRWFEVPYSGLKAHPDGDGAFVALSIGFLLFERYYRIVTGSQDEVAVDKARNKGAEDMNVNKEFFSVFWSTYRNGLMHQGTPQIYERTGKKYKWMIDATFEAYPTYFDYNGFRFICLNPWKFTEFAMSKFLNDPDRLNGSVTYQLGIIDDKALPGSPVRVRTVDPYP
jgi:hypothetical protein